MTDNAKECQRIYELSKKIFETNEGYKIINKYAVIEKLGTQEQQA